MILTMMNLNSPSCNSNPYNIHSLSGLRIRSTDLGSAEYNNTSSRGSGSCMVNFYLRSTCGSGFLSFLCFSFFFFFFRPDCKLHIANIKFQ